MSQKLDTLQAALERILGERIAKLVRARGEITVTVKAADYAAWPRRCAITPTWPSSS